VLTALNLGNSVGQCQRPVEERFRLDVEATARGDEEESRRLTQGCPRHSYTLNDLRFSWRWEAARDLTSKGRSS
jgi:hypothetical protein